MTYGNRHKHEDYLLAVLFVYWDQQQKPMQLPVSHYAHKILIQLFHWQLAIAWSKWNHIHDYVQEVLGRFFRFRHKFHWIVDKIDHALEIAEKENHFLIKKSRWTYIGCSIDGYPRESNFFLGIWLIYLKSNVWCFFHITYWSINISKENCSWF